MTTLYRTVKAYPIVICFFVFVVGVALSVLTGWELYNSQTKTIVSEFKRDVDDKVRSIEREIALSFEVLHSLKALYDSSENVTQEEFSTAVKMSISRHKSIKALAWIPKVEHTDREKFEQSHLAEHPYFQITERKVQGVMIQAKERPIYYPVSYVEPFVGNEITLGFDLSSSKKRLDALESAMKTGQLTTTEGIILLRGREGEKGFLAILPIYNGMPSTVDMRTKLLQGFVIGAYRIEQLFHSSINHTSAKGINFVLTDITNGINDILLEHNVSDREAVHVEFSYQKIISLSGRTWAVSAVPSIGYVAEKRNAFPYFVTLALLLFVMVGVAFIYLLLRRSAVVELGVRERTKELNQAKEKLERLMMTDKLTGLANRRHFDTVIEKEWARAIRENEPMALLMIDIDYFKKYNDFYGHLAGDACLEKVGETLKLAVKRPTDLVARYGGEEFVILLPNTNSTDVVAGLCRQFVEELHIPHESSDVCEVVTISIGACVITPSRNLLHTDFMNMADKALYQAKHKGRNQICSINKLADTESKGNVINL